MPRFIAFALLLGCAPIDLGDDFDGEDVAVDTSAGDTNVVDASRDPGSGGSIDPLDPNYFFCFVQAQVYREHGCASAGNNCHASESSLRLDPMPEITPPLACSNGAPVEDVPAAYYTNLARSRGEVRSTAQRSELYLRPLGSDHPVDLFTSSSPEAQILRNWIEGTR